MPETRKHEREARDALDEAVFAAIGEPVRPATPGATPPPADADDAPLGPETVAPLGTWTFTVGPAPEPTDD